MQARRAFGSSGGKSEVRNAHTVAEGRRRPPRGRFVGQQQVFRLQIPMAVGAGGKRGGRQEAENMLTAVVVCVVCVVVCACAEIGQYL